MWKLECSGKAAFEAAAGNGGRAMDMGDLTSRQIGDLMSGGILRAEEQLRNGRNFMVNVGLSSQNELAGIGHAAFAGLNEADRGTIPSTIKNQNLGHNSKKVGMGPNTKR